MSQRPTDGVRPSGDPQSTTAGTSVALATLCAALAERYDVQDEVGRGASGHVYRTLDRVRGETVALKALREEFASAVGTARFLREIQIGQHLQHPRIIPIFDSGSAAGRPYYTMPLVAGPSLRDRLAQERQLSLGDAIAIAAQVAEALDVAHASGVIHRDIKPGNILIGENGAVVADFGIARAIDVASGDTLTDSGIAIGTPEYMSPEQAGAQPGLDGRSDIYSLGCVVYEMLAGEPPFTGPSQQAIIARHFHEAPRSIRVVRPAVPAGVEAAVERALAKVPADRFATAGAFAQALTVALTAPHAVLATGVTRRRTMRMAIGAGATVVVLAAITFTVNGRFSRGALPNEQRAELAAGTTVPDARRAYNRGQVALEAGDFARADSEFSAATRADADFPQPLMWLAVVRSWTNVQAAPWAQLVAQAERANAQRQSLIPADTLRLSALHDLAARRRQTDCAIWSRVVALQPNDFATWYSNGACLRYSQAVIRSGSSPTGWHFVTSFERALRAYEQAFRLRPALMHGLGSRALFDLQELFTISSTRVRSGAALAPDSGAFSAYPTWERDTIAYYPVPRTAALLGAPPEAVALAIQKQRERLAVVVRLWRTEFPRRADAAEAVAVSLELLGNSAALDTLRLARSLSTSASDVLRIAATEVVLRVKYAIPDDLGGLRSAVNTADSLLALHPPGSRTEQRMLGSLAALLGRAGLASAYASAGGLGEVSPALVQSAPRLITFAALGGPVDSLRALEQRATLDMQSLPEPERSINHARWIVRAATLAYPDFAMAVLRAPPSPANAGAAIPAAALSRDRMKIVELVEALARARRPTRVADVMIDGVFPEGAAFAAVGDDRRAAARLDPTLESIRLSAASDLGQIPRTGTLVRAMALRAILADRLGDAVTAKRWAAAVTILWSGADAFLSPTLKRMQTFAR